MANYRFKKTGLTLVKSVHLFAFSCLVCLIFIMPGLLNAQTFEFNSGSTGENGPFPPGSAPSGTTDITVDLNNGKVTYLPNDTFVTLPNTPLEGFGDGVFNFTTVNLPSDITLTFIKHINNPPITILAMGDIVIDGTIDVSGKNGEKFKSTGLVSIGGEGGHAGFNGGNGGALGSTNNIGGAGFGPGGGRPGTTSARSNGGIYGTANDFVALIPLFGGSGGGGGYGNSSFAGSSGGGGGGAILLASSKAIILDGTVNANGGNGAVCRKNISNVRMVGTGGGGGGGGAIRLVAKTITGAGSLRANGGSVDSAQCANPGAKGRIRLEAFTQTFSGSTSPGPSVAIGPGPVTTTGNPPLVGLPTLAISSVAGVNTPTATTSNLSIPDLSLPQGTTNPVSVVITTNNIPVGTTFTVSVTPQFGNAVDVTSTVSEDTGNPGEAKAAAQVNLPVGEIAILSAFTDFTIQTASLIPIIDGEKIDRVMVASNVGEKSLLSFVTKSGRIISDKEILHSPGIQYDSPLKKGD